MCPCSAQDHNGSSGLGAAGGAEKPVSSTSPPFMTIGRSSHPTAKCECYLKAICQRFHFFLLATCWKNEKLWLRCVINEEGWKKMTFCCTCCLRKDMLSMVRPHSMQILKACKSLKLEVLLTLEEKADSRLGLRKKISFHQYFFLLYWWMDAAHLCCGLCPVYLLNLRTFYFWAIIVSRAGHKVGSWRALLSLPSSLSLNFWAWGLAFEQNFCDGDCRD